MVLGNSVSFFPRGGFSCLKSLAREPAMGQAGDLPKLGSSRPDTDPEPGLLSPALCSPSSSREVFPMISCTERMGSRSCEQGPVCFFLLRVTEPPLWLCGWSCGPFYPKAVNGHVFAPAPRTVHC